MTPPGDNGTTPARRTAEQRRRRLSRCAICTRLIWFHPTILKEPVEAPEPRQTWILCKACYEALLAQMQRASIRSPIRLRIALGLVAAERSPQAYPTSSPFLEEQTFQREFAWAVRAMILFAILHLVIFAIVLAVPK